MMRLKQMTMPSRALLVLLLVLLSLLLRSVEVTHASGSGSGTWTPTGSLTVARARHTATLLPNGQVLVAGGFGSGGDLTSAELYDPSSGTWTTTGSLNAARDSHTATLLPNGQVLVAGGESSGFGFGGPLASAELYDPSSGTWTPTGSMTVARFAHTAALLPNGQVLVAGGQGSSGPLASAELYSLAQAQISALINTVNSFNLAKGLQTSLDAKLKDALSAVNAGNTATACPDLTDFISEVHAQSGKKLTVAQANQLIAAAALIQAVLGC